MQLVSTSSKALSRSSAKAGTQKSWSEKMNANIAKTSQAQMKVYLPKPTYG